MAVVESDAAELESIPQAEPAAVVAPDRADLSGELAGPVLLPPIRITDPSAPGRPVVHRVLEDPVTQPVETVRSTPESVDVLRAPVTGLVANKVAVPPSLPPAAVGAAGATMLNPVAEQSLPQRVGRPSITFQRRSTRPRVRRVTRVIRHVDTWSVFKVALVFNAFLYAVALTSGVLLWHVAVATGTIDNVEKFFEGFGWSSFQFRGGQIYHNAWIGGLFVAIGLTGLAVL
ncbi:MAG: DUF3566 domain-containing protein [Ilumatobacteraceae bacterium]